MKFKLNITMRLGALVFIIVANTSFAQQDPMYSQYMFNTQIINPAYAGTWESMGFLALARQQWVGFDGAPKTYTFSFQTPMQNKNMALGFNIVNDKIGLEKKFSVFGDYSYLVKINENTNLRLGLKGGFTNYSNNLQAYQLDLNGSSDVLFQGVIDTRFMPNFGVGAFLYNKNYYVGISVPKLVNNEFHNNYSNYSTQAELRHYFLIAGLVIDLGEAVKFKPTILTKVAMGTPVEVDLSANFLLKEKFWLGAMYRTGDSYGFIAQWIFDKNLRIGYALDYTTSNLKNFNNGTHEIMISYELHFFKERFVSPRYF